MMESVPAFLVAGRVTGSRGNVGVCARGSGDSISRRGFGSLLVGGALVLGNSVELLAREKPKIDLDSALLPIVRVQESCRDLIDGINDGTYEGSYAEITGIIGTIQRGNDLKENLKQVSLHAKPRDASSVMEHGRSALEYLSSPATYFNPADLKNKPTATYTNFVVGALGAVQTELGEVLKNVPSEAVSRAREALNGDI
ncbi:hypothetical protein NDN08_004389 [Rhodosorus marinus]|uniref:PS II complex 12 kDa extrinsic protein n=1 Tax=Rhodosorus marinus TaxID=101924 RepID=A0AAV8UL61_9RHOD|nr:hypothetical protein NDN08_004389 [Rhodosorus marinus]